MNNMMKILFALSVLVIVSKTVMAEPIVFVPLGSGNQVIAIDAKTDKILATFAGIDNPHGLVATPDGEYLIAGSLTEIPLASGQSIDTPNSKLTVIHPSHGHVMATIAVAGWTHHQAITPDGRYVISTHPTRGGISVVDMNNNQVVRTIKTGPSPNYAVVQPDGKYAYVTNSGNGTITEIYLPDMKVTRSLDAGQAPEHMVLSTDSRILYVTNPRVGKVSAVDIEKGSVVNSWQIGDKVHGLDIGDDGRTLYVSSKKGDKLVMLDPIEGIILKEISLSPAPYHLNTIKGTGKVYVSSRNQPIIWVVEQKSLKILGNIDLPAGEGHQMAIVSDSGASR